MIDTINSSSTINKFLENVDIVLNSNTFLLNLTVDFNNTKKAQHQLEVFAYSGNLKAELLKQDIERDWLIFHTINEKDEYILLEDGYLVKLEVEISTEQGFQYLRSMLTIEPGKHNFWSPYNKQIAMDKANELVKNFLYAIANDQIIKFYTLNTNFIYNFSEIRNTDETMAYFEGGYASDSATLLVREDSAAFMLLTNGID